MNVSTIYRETCVPVPSVVSASSVCAQFIEAMYVHGASGIDITPLHMNFEGSDPEKPVMRVPKTLEEEDKKTSW